MIFIKIFQKLSQFSGQVPLEHWVSRIAERLVIDLLYLQQRSVAEIQALTGWGASLVKVRAFRARQKLKTQLAQFTAEGNR